MKTYSFEHYKIILDDPIPVISGGTYEEHQWGPYQFPNLKKTRKGHIMLTCAPPKAEDSIIGYENIYIYGKVSEDGGTTWREIRSGDVPVGLVMPNGKEFFSPKPKNAFPAPWIDKYEPIYSREMIRLYRADEIPEFPRTPEASEYDPATGKTETFNMEVQWPNLAVILYVNCGMTGERVFPFDNLMGNMGYIIALPDGTMFMCTYGAGCSAETGEPVDKSFVTVLRSDDCGRHWQYQSQVIPPNEWSAEKWIEGFCEPCMTRMPDGSVIMLMRTGSGKPSYITRSTDDCRTWSEPVIFDNCGVFPQLLTMPCGITLASYGRPGVFLRSTSDKAGLAWDTPIDCEVIPGLQTCAYTGLLPLDDTTALMTYSHFAWPNADGVPVKTILVRKIHIEM